MVIGNFIRKYINNYLIPQRIYGTLERDFLDLLPLEPLTAGNWLRKWGSWVLQKLPDE